MKHMLLDSPLAPPSLSASTPLDTNPSQAQPSPVQVQLNWATIMTSIEIANNAAQEAAATSHFRSCRMQSLPHPTIFLSLIPLLLSLAGRASSPAVSCLCNSTRIQLCSTKLLYFISCCCCCGNSLSVARVIDMALFCVAFPFPREATISARKVSRTLEWNFHCPRELQNFKLKWELLFLTWLQLVLNVHFCKISYIVYYNIL